MMVKTSQIDNGKFSIALVEPATFSLLQKIAEYLKPQQEKVYVVGGLIRDALMGRETIDIDLAVTGDALKIAYHLATELSGTCVLLDSDNRIGRIVLTSKTTDQVRSILDISTITSTLENDLSRRDFTVNAMAVDLYELIGGDISVNLIDPHGGCGDLDHGVIRSIDEKNLKNDPLRLLRAVRFAVELGFQIESKTRDQISNSASLLINVAGERIKEELVRLFTVSRGGRFLLDLDKFGLLDVIIPELIGTKGVNQPSEHHWDVFTHSIMTVTAVDYLLRQGIWEYPQPYILNVMPWSNELTGHFEKPVAGGSNRRTLLKLTALLHDIAKPQTRTIENGKMRFLGHSEQGSEIVSSILERLRFSTRETKMVAGMVKYHLRPTQMGLLPSHRAIYRYFRDTGDLAIDVLFLSLADHLATRGPDLIQANWRQHTGTIRYILDEHYKQEEKTLPPALVNGNDIMSVFKLKPGRLIGELLSMVKEAQATGELTTREQALEYIHNVLAEGKR